MNKRRIFEDFLSENIDRAFRFAYSYVKNREDAEDILCESVEKALKSIDSLKHPEYIKSWFYKIVSNTALTFLSKRNKRETLNIDDFSGNSVCDDYSNLDFENLIKVLDIKYKSVLVLRFMEDMKISDIAKILNLSENTVKTRLYKALEILKAVMEGIEI